MPTGQVDTIIQETAQSDQLQSQVKLCASCHGPLSNDPPNSNPNRSILSETAPIEPFCATCTILFFSPRSPSNPAERRSICADDGARLDSSHDFAVVPQPSPLHIDAQHPDDAEMSSPSSLESDGVFHRSQSTPQAAPPPRSPPCQRTPLKINTTSPAISAISSPSVALSSIALSPGNSRRHDDPVLSPDPLIDITRLRVRSKTHHCLYPGASFQGTQKSGRNSYDVNVTIVDVDFNTSFLCGYLRIRGLTDDWPELTTYFDAEIIGSRYGFLTQGWGATEGEDMMHWQRFPAFRQVKNDLKQPYLTMDNSRDRGAVFMRWKERFLVPDHRVHDINGASFAGFYYVCVDFNPQQTQTPTLRPVTQQIHSRQTDYDPTPVSMPSYSPAFPKPDTPSRGRRNSSAPQMNRSSPSASRTSAPVATMGGFYYHQNSEPYQQLSLCHVPERTSSTFEFR